MSGRTVARGLCVVVLLGTGMIGSYNGARELGQAHGTLQRSVTLGVLLYGVFGLLAALALVARHPAVVWLAIAWACLTTYVASAAAIAYAGSDATVLGAIMSGVSAALIGWGVVYTARRTTRSKEAAAERPRSGH